MNARHEIWWRKPTIINTDPQRRRYNGCNFSEEEGWTEWQCLYELATLAEAEVSIASYQAINRTWQYKAIPAPSKLRNLYETHR